MTALLDLAVVTGIALMDALLLAGFVALVLYFWRQWRLRRSGETPRPQPAAVHSSRQVALDILEERYQRGEIDAAEREGRRDLLSRER
jgi:uncharacterized membrane protein